MDNENEKRNGFHPSRFQALKKLFQNIWQKIVAEKEEPRLKGVCPSCGALVLKFKALDGAGYMVAVADQFIFRFLDSRTDIDRFVFDRLKRAELIIVELRKELRGKGR